MLHLTTQLPHALVVACSGGVDSMAVLDFLRRKHNVTVAYYHHGTVHGDAAHDLVSRYAASRGLTLHTERLDASRPAGYSQEEWWRECRYTFFDRLPAECGPIVTAHHLDDVVETYLWGALHGTPKLIPHNRGRVIRPFLTTRKNEFVDWCTRHGVSWVNDDSNTDTRYTRNYIRHNLLPHALRVNPGIHKTVKRMVDKSRAECENSDSLNNKLELQHG